MIKATIVFGCLILSSFATITCYKHAASGTLTNVGSASAAFCYTLEQTGDQFTKGEGTASPSHMFGGELAGVSDAATTEEGKCYVPSGANGVFVLLCTSAANCNNELTAPCCSDDTRCAAGTHCDTATTHKCVADAIDPESATLQQCLISLSVAVSAMLALL